MECTVIVPVIKINDLLSKIVNNTLSCDKNLKIIIIYNVYSKKILPSKRIKLFKSNERNIGSKRNIGVNKSNTKYIAFLDSDAYPDKDWLTNAKFLLEKNPSLGIVTGPELSFPDQSFFENTVGICNRSFLITGSHNFRKSNSKSRYYSEASACNIIMRKEDYLLLNGMNPNIYLGEDQEFSHRVSNILKKKIFFSNNVKIFHKDRDVWGYIIQRYARGVVSSNLFSKLKNFSKIISIENFLNQRFEMLIPLFFILFLLSAPLIFFYEIWKTFFFTITLLYFFIIFLETIKLTRNKLIFFLPVLFLLILGSLVPGIAQLFKMLNIKIDTSQFYRNKNDI